MPFDTKFLNNIYQNKLDLKLITSNHIISKMHFEDLDIVLVQRQHKNTLRTQTKAPFQC